MFVSFSSLEKYKQTKIISDLALYIILPSFQDSWVLPISEQTDTCKSLSFQQRVVYNSLKKESPLLFIGCMWSIG